MLYLTTHRPATAHDLGNFNKTSIALFITDMSKWTKAASTSEMLVHFSRLQGATAQKTAIFWTMDVLIGHLSDLSIFDLFVGL
jgi:hypothetical protein